MERIKYPRTPHLPWSPGATSDDRVLSSCAHFEGKRVVVTEKLDGENSTIYPDGSTHARSTDSKHHPSRSWLKANAPSWVVNGLSQGYRVCGENLYAFHSILYCELPSYFFVFGLYDQRNLCVPWEDTVEGCVILGMEHVPVIWEGVWDEQVIRSLWNGQGRYPTYETQDEQPTFPDSFSPCEAEGYVVRLADAFAYDDYELSVAKFVRKNHVQTDEHWMSKPVFPNRLRTLYT